MFIVELTNAALFLIYFMKACKIYYIPGGQREAVSNTRPSEDQRRLLQARRGGQEVQDGQHTEGKGY